MPDSYSRKIMAPKKFRVDRAKFGFTWSCPKNSAENPIASSEVVLDFLKTIGPSQYVICRELHENGKFHFHAWVKFDTKVETRDVHFFDVCGVHPNIILPKGGWLDYVQKAGDFISNLEPDPWVHALKQETADEAMEVLWKKRPRDMCLNAHNVERNVRSRFCLPQVPIFQGPFGSAFHAASDGWNRATHSLHLWGPAAAGKTTYAKTLFPNFTYVKGSIQRLRKIRFDLPLILDDLSGLGGLEYDELKVLTDIVDGGSIRLLWGEITIPPGLPRVFLSNGKLPFGELMSDPDKAIYGRRVTTRFCPRSGLLPNKIP